MLDHIFKQKPPSSFLIQILDQICVQYADADGKPYYVMDEGAHKKLIYMQLNVSLCEQLLPFYHKSKQFYVTREMTYNSFVNLVRQLCKIHSIPYYSKIKYGDADYNTVYYVYAAPAAPDEPGSGSDE